MTYVGRRGYITVHVEGMYIHSYLWTNISLSLCVVTSCIQTKRNVVAEPGTIYGSVNIQLCTYIRN